MCISVVWLSVWVGGSTGCGISTQVCAVRKLARKSDNQSTRVCLKTG